MKVSPSMTISNHFSKKNTTIFNFPFSILNLCNQAIISKIINTAHGGFTVG